MASAPKTQDHADIPEQVGPYRVIEYLSEGGMGYVYLAERREPHQQVALKVIKHGMDMRAMLARFAIEQQAVAIMEHHNIAKFYGSGEMADGRPYFAMEYVKGEPITHYCDQHRLGVSERLELFRQVCSGVQHAHQKGIMHRDLKPSNVLVTAENDKPVPKIIDFGLARATDATRGMDSLLTEYGARIGTLEYMAPEQAGLGKLDVDTRVDVYALGVLLYELLVGTLPFTRKELLEAGELELRRIIREVDPPRPSMRLRKSDEWTSEVARLRSTNPSTLQRTLRSDLDKVVLMAMAKERHRRYDTPAQLAEEVRRFLNHEPLIAVDPSVFYRLRKFTRRYRVQSAAAAAVVLAMVGGTAASWIGFDNATRAQSRAEAAADALAEANRFLGHTAQLRSLESQRSELYPPWPRNLTRLRSWVAEARTLLAALPDITMKRAQLQREQLQALGSTSEHALLLDSLRLLEQDLEGLDAEGGPLPAVERDLAWAETIEKRSIDDYRSRWDAAREAIRSSDGVRAHEYYDGFDLEPQLGLVPLGMNPVTRLWEFYHLRSAAPDTPIPFDAVFDTEGPPDPAWGIVFVLVPGREHWLGAQKRSRDEPNYDPRVDDQRHNLELQKFRPRPFFLARYELTRLHWLRLVYEQNAELVDPSFYRDPSYNRIGSLNGTITSLNPVEWVSYEMARPVLARHGLMLPDERQWEFACRGDTTSVWFTGNDPMSMLGYGNFADDTNVGNGGTAPPVFDDGHSCHTPVGTFKPNNFGFYDILGNVWEITTDRFDDNPTPSFVLRGGSWMESVLDSRCARRGGAAPVLQSQATGVRAARRVD